jgi:hypothetical protein
MRKASEEVIAQLRVTLITAMLDVAEDLSADHVDEILPDEILEDEQADAVRALTAQWLVYELIQGVGAELLDTLRTVKTSSELRGKYPRQAFVLTTGVEPSED